MSHTIGTVSHHHYFRTLPVLATSESSTAFVQPWRYQKLTCQHNDLRPSLVSLSALDESTLWGIRATSLILSYVGFIGYYDRPRGQLLVNDNQIEIKDSTVPGAGLGLFAKQNLPKGTVLGTYPGVVIPLSQNLNKLRNYPACEAYIWRFSDNAFVIDPTNKEGKVDAVCIGGRDGLPASQWLFANVFRMSTPTALCRINEPPLGKDVNVVTDEDLNGRCVTFSLEKDVRIGEEFFIDYGLSYDRSMYGGGAEDGSNNKNNGPM